jgi:hypothetical protein
MIDICLSNLPLNGLRAFEAAARHLSFRDAADELAVTPGAISHQPSDQGVGGAPGHAIV